MKRILIFLSISFIISNQVNAWIVVNGGKKQVEANLYKGGQRIKLNPGEFIFVPNTFIAPTEDRGLMRSYSPFDVIIYLDTGYKEIDDPDMSLQEKINQIKQKETEAISAAKKPIEEKSEQEQNALIKLRVDQILKDLAGEQKEKSSQ